MAHGRRGISNSTAFKEADQTGNFTLEATKGHARLWRLFDFITAKFEHQSVTSFPFSKEGLFIYHLINYLSCCLAICNKSLLAV